MRLLSTRIDTKNENPLVLEDFPGEDVPPYAILSHTWGKDEVLLSHVEHNDVVKRRGYVKITRAMRQARNDGLEYVWIDTCCIDKASSAELSEAINSMFEWYSSAAVCYACLEDISIEPEFPGDLADLTRSRWFTRGWCLQELLAPQEVVFYDRHWSRIGDKHSLRRRITSITRIDAAILLGHQSIRSASIAIRMSWASSRETTRVEDIAYCLMGIFAVNMPMLYGEGTRAFQRLQEEIIKHSDDHSIFAWRDSTIPLRKPHGLLADSPAAFAGSSNVARVSSADDTSFETTNKGLRMNIVLSQSYEQTQQEQWPCLLAAISCTLPGASPHERLTIYLVQLDSGQYGRINCDEMFLSAHQGQLTTMHVNQRLLDSHHHVVKHTDFLFLSYEALARRGYDIMDKVELTLGAEEQRQRSRLTRRQRGWYPRLLKSAGSLSAAALLRRRDEDDWVIILLGRTADSRIGVDATVSPTGELGDLEELQRQFRPKSKLVDISASNHRFWFSVRIEVRDVSTTSRLKFHFGPLPVLPDDTSHRLGPVSDTQEA